MVLENIDAMLEKLNQIKDMGVNISIDDFGTGYSSLSYLHQFHIDILKIDRSFIRFMQNDSEPNPIITTIAALAEAMSMKIVAEGIEEIYQLEKLTAMGCQYGQGFLFSKPLPKEEAFKLFSEGISV